MENKITSSQTDRDYRPGPILNQRVDVSIVISTFNPEERIIKRLLDSIINFKADKDFTLECLMVDNNSTPSLESAQYIRDFLKKVPWARIVREENQGLVFARMAGIEATAGDILIFFDDDNVPDAHYCENAFKLMQQNPTVGVWGAGKISVEFVDSIPGWLRARARLMHNERTQDFPAFGCTPARWFDFYPIGMGQVVRRTVAEKYCGDIRNGRLKTTDRIGHSLASGGDIQIVWQAAKMNLSAGTHPDLKMKHLIPARRCSIRYLKRLAFGTASSYAAALVESFPVELENIRRGIPANKVIVRQLLRLIWRHVRLGQCKFLTISIANYLGGVIGSLRASGNSSRRWVFRLAKKMGLE